MSAFWVEIDRPGSAPDMRYICGVKKAKNLLQSQRNGYTVVIPVVGGGNGLAGYRCACARVSVCTCACVNEHRYCLDCLSGPWIFVERTWKVPAFFVDAEERLLCTLIFERYCRGDNGAKSKPCSPIGDN